jgi:hypothetical protein
MPIDQAASGPPVAKAAEMANRIDIPSSGSSTRPSPNLPDVSTTRTIVGPSPTSVGNPAASPPMGGADLNAGNPDLTDGKAVPAIAIPAARTPTAQEQRMETMYATRGDEMLAIKDISAARKFYEYAANAGSTRAATALAESYDPAFLTQLGAVGIRPDPALAAAWYGKAVALGDAEARLRTQFAK